VFFPPLLIIISFRQAPVWPAVTFVCRQLPRPLPFLPRIWPSIGRSWFAARHQTPERTSASDCAGSPGARSDRGRNRGRNAPAAASVAQVPNQPMPPIQSYAWYIHTYQLFVNKKSRKICPFRRAGVFRTQLLMAESLTPCRVHGHSSSFGLWRLHVTL
jgi:hypothetical protein